MSLLGIGISMAQIMGPRIEPSSGNNPSLIDIEVHRRMWWTLVMADCWSSSSLALPRLIEENTLSIEPPMDEATFGSLSPDEQQPPMPWQPGLWAHMISLVRLFSPIQDLNRRSAKDTIKPDELEREVASLSRQLEIWEWKLPADAKMSDENLDRHRHRGTGGPFVALHLGYHHYSTLLYFRFLEPRPSTSSDTTAFYREKCVQQASAYSHLLGTARGKGDCEVLYPTVGHMAVVFVSLTTHTSIR